jgi:hypothetical protein
MPDMAFAQVGGGGAGGFDLGDLFDNLGDFLISF